MKGLIIKDFLLLGKTIKLYAIILAFYAMMSITTGESSFFSTMVALFSAMLPVTALAYDERAKWDRYALTMPISRKDIVVSKYCLGAILCGIGLVLSLVANLFNTEMLFEEKIYFSLTMLGVCLFYQAIILPIIFKFGSEKGRIYMMMAYLVPAAIIFLGASYIKNISIDMSLIENFIKFSPIVAIVIWFASIKISLMAYNSQKQ